MRRTLTLVLLASLLLAACSDKERPADQARQDSTSAPAAAVATPAQSAGAAASPAPPPAAAKAPRFEPGDCPFRPAMDPVSVRSVTCGTVAVPEVHARPDGPSIRLAVAVFKGRGDTTGAAPLVWLDGGPGGPSLETIGRVIAGSFAQLLLNGHDLVLFDQRGVGHSTPSLACRELTDLKYDALGKQLSREEAARLTMEASLRCRDRLVKQGINLAAYTTAQNAADVNDIRIALGYDEVNLYGVSYGTRLALTVMRDFPTILRAVVLDSTVPVQSDLYPGIFTSAERSFRLLFDRCAADAACNRAYPALERAFYDLVAKLDRESLPVRLVDPRTGTGHDLLLTGDRLVGYIFSMLYRTDLIPALPRIVDSLRSGNPGPFARAVRDIVFDDAVSQGMYYSVQCGEEVRFTTPEAAAAAERSVRPEIAAAIGGDSTDVLFGICAAWGARPAPQLENEPVSSDVPAIILEGEYDPITPPAYGELAARTLSHGRVYLFPGVGHGVILGGACPFAAISSFLANPESFPDGACLAAMRAPDWTGGR